MNTVTKSAPRSTLHAPRKPDLPPASEDYSNLVNLLSVLTEASNQLAALAANANEGLTEILDDLKSDYARLQETVTTTTTAIETIARRHPEWFKSIKTLKTPYGEVKFHTSTSLVIPNEELTLVLIRNMAERDCRDYAAALAGTDQPDAKPFDARPFIRQREELNLEALEKLDDATLAELRIKRVAKENFSAKPASLDLGKAVKEAAEKEVE